MNFKLNQFGVLMIILGTVGFLAAVIISFTAYSGMDQGALPAASFLSILLGIAFAFPSLLKGPRKEDGFSTMRIIVFAVVLLFCTIYLKIGWSISKFEEFTIDQRWIYILGLAFGSKAFQRFGETSDGTNNGGQSIQESVSVKKETKKSTPGGKDTSDDLTNT